MPNRNFQRLVIKCFKVLRFHWLHWHRQFIKQGIDARCQRSLAHERVYQLASTVLKSSWQCFLVRWLMIECTMDETRHDINHQPSCYRSWLPDEGNHWQAVDNSGSQALKDKLFVTCWIMYTMDHTFNQQYFWTRLQWTVSDNAVPMWTIAGKRKTRKQTLSQATAHMPSTIHWTHLHHQLSTLV